MIEQANYAAALAIELRRGSPPDSRDFLRFKFKNGTKEEFETVHVLGHHADIPLTEFIYRTEVCFVWCDYPNSERTSQSAAITSNKQWAQVCGARVSIFDQIGSSGRHFTSYAGVVALIVFIGVFLLSRFVRRSRALAREQRRVDPQLEDDSVSPFTDITLFIPFVMLTVSPLF